MDDTRAARLVERALRCYPARWRRRHGDEAAELAALLIRDGAWPGSIALSYLAGAAREWLTPRPGQRLSTASLRAADRRLLAERLGGAGGRADVGQGGPHAGAGQGREHGPGARARALPAGRGGGSGAGVDPCHGPAADDHLGGRA